MNILMQARPMTKVMFKNTRKFSLWSRFIPRFLKRKTKTKVDGKTGQVVPVSQDEIRMKILMAEVEESMEVYIISI